MEIVCPKCQSTNNYQDRDLQICLECGEEWNPATLKENDHKSIEAVKDAFGNILEEGDSITLIKELKLKGGSGPLKIGTKFKNIKLIDEHNGHNVSCRSDESGQIYLKSEYVKKS